MIDWESDRFGRQIREAIWIRKNSNINRDGGSNRLSHEWDSLLIDIRNQYSPDKDLFRVAFRLLIILVHHKW